MILTFYMFIKYLFIKSVTLLSSVPIVLFSFSAILETLLPLLFKEDRAGFQNILLSRIFFQIQQLKTSFLSFP